MPTCNGNSRAVEKFGGTGKVRESGGFQYDFNGRTITIQQKNGIAYDVSDLADIPSKIGKGINANELMQRAKKNGRTVKILSPKEMSDRVENRRKERENKPDYEHGIGTPWGNKNNRKAARQQRLTTRVQRRAR